MIKKKQIFFTFLKFLFDIFKFLLNYRNVFIKKGVYYMSNGSQSYASKISKWKMMVAGYEKHKSDISFAEKETKELNDLIAKIEPLEIKQEHLKAELQKTTADLTDTIKNGDKLSASILRYAKGKYGPKSLEIKDFQ
jgi:hypothetical protein